MMDFDADATHPTTSLGVYALGMLAADEEHAVRRHLEDCAGCRVEVDDLEGMAELLAAARLVPRPPEPIAEAVLADLAPQGTVADPASGAPQGALEAVIAASRLQSETEVPEVEPAATQTADDTAETGDAAADGEVAGPNDLIIRPTPPRIRDVPWLRHTLGYLLALGAGALAALAFVWMISALTDTSTLSAALVPVNGGSAGGSVVADATQSGLELRLEVENLETGTYTVTIASDDGAGGSVEAGSFRVDSGSADVTMSAAVDGGEVVVADAAGRDEIVLRGTLAVD